MTKHYDDSIWRISLTTSFNYIFRERASLILSTVEYSWGWTRARTETMPQAAGGLKKKTVSLSSVFLWDTTMRRFASISTTEQLLLSGRVAAHVISSP
jgi:hypothetical protein